MVVTKSRRGAKTKGPKKADEQNILLARGMSARYPGANVPLSGLSGDEVERDMRHMEAFANACTAYTQQYYIYLNQDQAMMSKNEPAAQPLVAMPVRIDPEEEKRLANLRQKIQNCEEQREILESQYLSLRAHYVYLSQQLKKFRGEVSKRVEFLQSLVQKRGALVGLQRARLQIVRDVLKCLKYRQKTDYKHSEGTSIDDTELMKVWNMLDEKIKKVEKEARKEEIQGWSALRIPRTPPGVPLMLSQLAGRPGNGAAFTLSGSFGAKKHSMCWLDPNLPEEPPEAGEELPGLREDVDLLESELEKERNLNRDLQINIIARRKRNDELVAMMSLLRSETEAVVARHNILLDSDKAKEAAIKLHREEQLRSEQEDAQREASGENGSTQGNTSPPKEINGENDSSEAAVPEPEHPIEQDNENDGDDEGAGEDDDDEEGEAFDGGNKREVEKAEGESPRTAKRRRL